MLKDYLVPSTIDAALFMLKEKAGKARIVAGGTDIVIQERGRESQAEYLVDISKIAELSQIRLEGGYLYLGAGLTHAAVAASALVKENAEALATACLKVGGHQIRNMGTIGGNIVTALPAADAAVALSALGAECTVRSCCGKSETKPLADMYAGIAQSTLDDSSQILSEIRVPICGANSGTSFQRMEQRKALSLPMLCVAAKMCLKGKVMEHVAIAAAPVGVGPKRMTEIENFLIGKEVGTALFEEAAQLSHQYAAFRSSAVRGSKEFRESVLPVFIVQALEEASAKAMA